MGPQLQGLSTTEGLCDHPYAHLYKNKLYLVHVSFTSQLGWLFILLGRMSTLFAIQLYLLYFHPSILQESCNYQQINFLFRLRPTISTCVTKSESGPYAEYLRSVKGITATQLSLHFSTATKINHLQTHSCRLLLFLSLLLLCLATVTML